MRDSLMKFEREHKMKEDTKQGLEQIKRTLNISATARGGLRNSMSKFTDAKTHKKQSQSPKAAIPEVKTAEQRRIAKQQATYSKYQKKLRSMYIRPDDEKKLKQLAIKKNNSKS